MAKFFNRGFYKLSKHDLTYSTWKMMRHRCRSNKGYYANVTVCDAWEDFEQFLADMGPRPSTKHSIDRIDPYGNYEPQNCRWATQKQQSNNKRWHHSAKGYWRTVAEKNGISGNTWQWRMREKGMSPEEAATTVLGRWKK